MRCYWMIGLSCQILFSLCTSSHKHEQKDRLKTLADFPDYHISIDYRSTSIKQLVVLKLPAPWNFSVCEEN